jgi:hypothetical protein
MEEMKEMKNSNKILYLSYSNIIQMRRLMTLAVGFTSLMSMVMIMPNALASHGSSPAACEADGYEAGQDGPFSQELYETCQGIGAGYEYYDAFIEGCMDADNSRDVCESATD